MFRSRSPRKDSPVQASTPDLDDASSIIDEADVDVDVDVDAVASQKPHFLDYDAVPPPDFEENFDRVLSFGIRTSSHQSVATAADVKLVTAAVSSTGEQLKLDKKYERDGEISDYELAASGYTKKEFTQDDNTLHLASSAGVVGVGAPSHERSPTHKTTFAKPKHFLDENPIPPDYMLAHDMREHRSLDRNFERQNEPQQRTESPSSLGGGGVGGGGGRKSSLDRGSSGSRSSRERFKEPSYTLSRFLDSDAQIVGPGSPTSLSHQQPLHRSGVVVPKGGAWTDSFDSRYGSLQLPSTSEVDTTLGSKVECVYSLLSILGSNDPLETSKKFLELSRTPESCAALRRSGCIPLLVQMMHSEGEDSVRKWSGMALHNVVHSHPDEKAGRREAKVLRLLDQIMDYCNFLKTLLQSGGEAIADDSDRHPLAAISSLMKVSFDEEHRHAMCELGALQAIPSLVHLDHAVHGPKPEDQCCNSLRRYALMALTNLTFGDENNKALLCSQKLFMEALVAQLDSAPDDLLQVTASVLRNLSWRADSNMKSVLNEIGTVTALARAAMKNKSENTLKAILSALWNLSAHCSTNKAEFCAVDGALAFLVDMLSYEGPSKTLKIIENSGGILRNVSSHIAVREHYRQILREHNCLSILLQQLKSESLTVVSNSCGTLWNLSARCPEDQKFLWDNGAVPMLRSLIHSKHSMISEGSSSALKNLLNFRPSVQNQNQLDPIARSMGLKKLPTLNARKQKALEQELGEKEHSETCDNLDITSKERAAFDGHLHTHSQRRYPLAAAGVVVGGVVPPTTRLTRSAMLTKSESRDSVFSVKSDSTYENFMRSHSASDSNRKAQKMSLSFATGHAPPRAAFALENDVESSEEQPIDYSATGPVTGSNYATYQETDLDQLTDFSLRYPENQIESDADISPPEAEVPTAAGISALQSAPDHVVQQVNDGNEILLILEDSVKCYQTEDTPYVISNAASVTDLRQNKLDNLTLENVKPSSIKKYQRTGAATAQQHSSTAYGSGSYTPEKTINYCEEGTPGYFSRYDSLSSLDESPAQQAANPSGGHKKSNTPPANNREEIPAKPANCSDMKPSDEVISSSPLLLPELPKQTDAPQMIKSNINSAQETPLMFSRHSSMDSLVEEDVGPCDDKSSVVSDFSRLASGVISPSEIPDSPTQSMPQSPRRNSAAGQAIAFSAGISPITPRGGGESKRPLRSVFEDNLNTFNEENTPAQFSCATSLSNLSILDDENDSPPGGMQQHQHSFGKASSSDATASTVENVSLQTNVISEGEEEESGTNNDDLLLANCINIGMNRTSGTKGRPSPTIKALHPSNNNQIPTDEPRHYYTEDTPALLSKVGSNTNLSAISMCSSNNELKDDTVTINVNRHSLNLSDDVSSNASESGAAGQSFDILQQCIRDGMKKPSGNTIPHLKQAAPDPIAMMRRGGTGLPPCLPVSDEMSKYLVEDSPCNFSVVSGLSNLTVGSSLVGPAVQLKGNASSASNPVDETSANRKDLPHVGHRQTAQPQEDVRREPQWQDDSLSSLSIDSEDDTNLLSQAIAAGCNRPKSNLGFSSTTSTSKRSTSLAGSQPIPINSATSASSLTSTAASRNYQRHQQPNNGNESYSSVDSSDSNDNQSKSLFELCILTGMHKSRDAHNSRKQHLLGSRGKCGDIAASTQSNPNLKQFDSLPVQLPPPLHLKHQQHQYQPTPNRHLRERERKDEKLLLECIKTGISKKIATGTGTLDNVSHTKSNANTNTHMKPPRESLFAANAVPKNVRATSAAALEPYHRMAAITSPSANSTAAPGVEKNNGISITTSSENNEKTANNGNNSINISPGGITGAPRSPPTLAAPVLLNEGPQSPEIVHEITNGIGCYRDNMMMTLDSSELSHSISLDNTTSDESNQSFIMETTISLENTQRTAVIAAADKHKDPDLMLKSVERLTLEFVSSAEQLRTNGSSDSNEHNKRLGSISVGGSNSNNTWNEDTCPNDVSFPSVSVSAPVVASLNYDDDDEDDEEQATEADHKELHDFAEITPTNEEQPQPSLGLIMCDDTDMYVNTQPNSLETETDTLVNDRTTESSNTECHTQTSSSSGINFKLGGEVQSAAAGPARHMFFNNPAMTNSTIIAIEARALAENLQHTDDDNTDLTFSINSLDLDNIRPPSGMDSLNISGYYQELSPGTQPNSLQQRSFLPQSPQFSTKSPKFPRKLLPPGLVARRALGQLPGHLSGSAESVNSSCNLLDNMKPPSLMDELLDSMISVASIQSEVAECESMATTVSVSNYETATNAGCNEFDDNTVTLQSCCDMLPRDGDDDDEASLNSGTPLPTDCDFSSAESTPKKSQGSPHGVKRTLTPKQKRKLAKDRFKTYTIAADIVLSEEQQQTLNLDETLQIEIVESNHSGGGVSAHRRRSSQERYKTQTIVFPPEALRQESCDEQGHYSLTSTDDCPSVSDDISSIRAMTKQFKFISTLMEATTSSEVVAPTEPRQLQECDYNSLECDQNSETESCHGQSTSLSDTELEPNDYEATTNNDSEARAVVRPRILKPGDPDFGAIKFDVDNQEEAKVIRGRKKPTYVSPYSMQYQRTNNVATVTRLATNKLITPKVITTNAFRKLNTNIISPPTSTAAAPKMAQMKKITEVTTPGPLLERQGTFVQDEPTIDTAQVPIVDSAAAATITITSTQSSPQRTSKLPTKRPAASPKMTATTRKLPSTSITTTTTVNSKISAARRIPMAATTGGPQRSNSNASIRVTATAARIASTRASATTPPSRSNSNLNSTTAATSQQQSTQNAAVKINQAQSRIAGIWKRVDEAKSKQHKTRTTTTTTTTTSAQATNLKTQQTKSSSALNTQKQQLIRSSTFDHTPDGIAAAAVAASTNTATTATATKPTAATSKIAVTRNIFSGPRKENIAARK